MLNESHALTAGHDSAKSYLVNIDILISDD